MHKSPFLDNTNFVTWLANKAWIISIDDDGQIKIELLRDEAFVVMPEQLPELVLNRNLISSDIAQAIYTAYQNSKSLINKKGSLKTGLLFSGCLLLRSCNQGM